MPPVNCIVSLKHGNCENNAKLAIISKISPDFDYYPNEEIFHKCLEIKFIDTSVQESNQISFLSMNAQIVSQDDLIIHRYPKTGDTGSFLQSIAFGIAAVIDKNNEITKNQVCIVLFFFFLNVLLYVNQ